MTQRLDHRRQGLATAFAQGIGDALHDLVTAPLQRQDQRQGQLALGQIIAQMLADAFGIAGASGIALRQTREGDMANWKAAAAWPATPSGATTTAGCANGSSSCAPDSRRPACRMAR